MLNRNAQYYEWLLPYLEGGLDEARRTQIESRLAADPALAAEAERLRRTREGLQETASRTPSLSNAQVPADLWPHLRARLVLQPAPPPRPSRAWWVAGVGAPAAAALLVAALWLPGGHMPDMPPLSRASRAPQAETSPKTASQKGSPQAPPAAVPAPAAAGAPRAVAATASVKKPTALLKPPAPVVPPENPFALPPSLKQSKAQNPAAVSPAGSSAAVPVSRTNVSAAAPPEPVAAFAPAPASAPALQSRESSTPSPIPPLSKPAPMAPPPPKAALGAQNLFGGSGLSGGANNGAFGGGAARQSKTAPSLLPAPGAAAEQRKVRLKTTDRHAAPSPAANAPQAPAALLPAGLEAWQAALSGAVQTPLWGENAGEQQANQALMAARESGMLDDLRARLEARRTQAPQDVVTGRMLASVYEFGFSAEPALRERRRVAALEGAVGEDWFALAQAEERAGNSPAARAAYRRALEAPTPPSAFHAALARSRSQ